MKEKETLEQAYYAVVTSLYNQFAGSYTTAQGNAEKEKQAETLFQHGILHARHIYTRALALLPE